MIVASVRSKRSPDGELVVIDRKNKTAIRAATCGYPSLLSALSEWDKAQPALSSVLQQSLPVSEIVPVSQCHFSAPLPRTWQFLDGSAFLEHVRRARAARGATFADELERIPLMYQGISAPLLGPDEDIVFRESNLGIDFEAELAVILKDTPAGISPTEAEQYIALVVLLNDVSLRNLIPEEIGRGFGFVQSKPPSSFAPFALTVDELGDAWKDGRAELEIRSYRNSDLIGQPNSKEMHFSFSELIAHAARTRPLIAGTIIGSGTIANKDETQGTSCLVERRLLEQISTGSMSTPYLQDGEIIRIEAIHKGASLFGQIEQRVQVTAD